MQITVTKTGEMTTLNGNPVAVWKGQTASGIPVRLLVSMVQCLDQDRQRQFETELIVGRPKERFVLPATLQIPAADLTLNGSVVNDNLNERPKDNGQEEIHFTG